MTIVRINPQAMVEVDEANCIERLAKLVAQSAPVFFDIKTYNPLFAIPSVRLLKVKTVNPELRNATLSGIS